MDTIIYRKSDRMIAGYVFPRRTEQQTLEALEMEVNNICQSELGGNPGDYALVAVEKASQPGFKAAIKEDGSVGFTPIPPNPRRVRIAELLAIPRSNWTTSQLRELLELSGRVLTG